MSKLKLFIALLFTSINFGDYQNKGCNAFKRFWIKQFGPLCRIMIFFKSFNVYKHLFIVVSFLFILIFINISPTSAADIGTDRVINFNNEGVGENLNQRSIHMLPFSNGYSAGIYDAKLHKLSAFYDMIYWFKDPESERKNLLEEAYFGVERKNFSVIWLKDIVENTLEYYEESGIIHATYNINGIHLECYYFTPFTVGKHTMTMIAILKNAENEEIIDCIKCDSNVLINRSTYKKGNDLYYKITLTLKGEIFEEATLEKEIQFWREFHSVEPEIPETYKTVYRQQTAFIKMAQSRENGQVLASLPPGEWSICWARDMCYAIVALVDSNHLEEAKFGLKFLLNGKAGNFKHFYFLGKDFGVGMDYFISICRYFGNGVEWSDELFIQEPKPSDELVNPNIEFDGFGLFVWAFSKYIKKSNDIDFLRDNMEKLRLTGDNIIGLIDKKVNLIKRDSSIWEFHLTLARHYLYTTIACAEGLKELSDLFSLIGEDTTTYTNGYHTLINGIKGNTDKNGLIKGSIEEKTRYYDASVVEAINFELVDDTIGLATIMGIEEKLYNGKGFKRTDNIGSYDRMEWIFINMRMAYAYFIYSEEKKALKLIDRTNTLANANFNIIPELYNSEDQYTGQFPMIGYGAGVFISAIYKWYSTGYI